MLFSASACSRVAACPSSVAFPAVIESSEDAERGVSLHAHCNRVLTGMPRIVSAARVPEAWRATAEKIRFKAAIGDLEGVRSEVSYAIHVASGNVRELGVNLGRNYVVWCGEVPGTNDFEGRREWDGIEVVGDWKTGAQDVAPCSENEQMLFHARVRSALTGAHVVEGRICYIRESGYVHVDRHEFTPFELDVFADELESTYASAVDAVRRYADGEVLAVHPGDHCRYCPAITSCPAHVALARAMLPELQDIEARIQEMTPVQRGSAWLKMKSCERVLTAVKNGLKETALEQAFPTVDGKEIREMSYPKETFSQDRAVALLTAKGATQEEIQGCYVESTVSQIREMKVRTL